jgi:hypothetical protein
VVPAAIIFWPTQELSIALRPFLGAFFTIVINVIGGAQVSISDIFKPHVDGFLNLGHLSGGLSCWNAALDRRRRDRRKGITWAVVVRRR